MSKQKEVYTGEYATPEKRKPLGGEFNPFAVDEIGDPLADDGRPEIERVKAEDLKDAADLEAFMHELVLIRVSEPQSENDQPVACVQVNGVNQPIPRGFPVRVKRHFVEALARTTVDRVDIELTDPLDPSRREVVQRTHRTYPFMVLEDSARGRVWLDKILRQPA